MSQSTDQAFRLAKGGRVDRNKPLNFTFDGVQYQGYAGDTLASALLANGVHLIGRSFKYHRPRGFMAAGPEEPNALMQLEKDPYTQPNTRATLQELYAGLSCESQNRWPSLKFDVNAVNSWVARALPSGFYYKTFMAPQKMWMTYEKIIRKAAGLGISPNAPDPDWYDHRHDYPDVLVVGGGPTGLAAALSAGRSGARVILVEQTNEFGGSLLSDTAEIDGAPAQQWVDAAVAELEAMPEVQLLTRTTLTHYLDYNYLIAAQHLSDHLGPRGGGKVPRQCLWKLRAKRVVLATGAYERPLVFADNDRPGIMMANTIRTWQHRFGVLPGRELVVFTNNDTAYSTAIDAVAGGANATIVDCRAEPGTKARAAASAAGIEVIAGSAITGVNYRGGLKGVEVMSLNTEGTDVQGQPRLINCDLVGSSGGWNPILNLHSQSKGKLRWMEAEQTYAPGITASINPSLSAGACNGAFDLSDCLSEGFATGAQAATEAGHAVAAGSVGSASETLGIGELRALWVVPCDHPLGQGKKKHFHEFQNDATAADLLLAQREGYVSVEHTKRYTTTGMANDQGKTSNINALGVVAQARGEGIPQVGITTFRPPFEPLTFGAIVGQNANELFHMVRKTPMHGWAEENGGVFEDVGDWKRTRYYPRAGEDMHTAVYRECAQVRKTVGMFDGSTLGKIDIQGPDAAWLLNMLYTNAWLKLAPGKCRYGLMLNEHGMVFDDGVTACIGENHYHMTTTTGGAARVLGWIEEWLQTEWPEKKVWCTSVTEQWAVIALNGPKAREVLASVCDIDLDAETFKFMDWRAGKVAGVDARVYRISFTGECAFEVNVPARYGRAVWEQLHAVGQAHDIVTYGTETMHVLRAEKGFIIVGQDSDGTMTPHDLAMDWIVSKAKPDFLGKRSHSRTDVTREGRKQLVGLLTDDPQTVLPEGTHIIEEVKPAPPMKMLGHVTSSYMSPNVDGGRSIAMASMKDGFKRLGETVDLVLLDGTHVTAKVVEPVFFDKEGARSRS